MLCTSRRGLLGIRRYWGWELIGLVKKGTGAAASQVILDKVVRIREIILRVDSDAPRLRGWHPMHRRLIEWVGESIGDVVTRHVLIVKRFEMGLRGLGEQGEALKEVVGDSWGELGGDNISAEVPKILVKLVGFSPCEPFQGAILCIIVPGVPHVGIRGAVGEWLGERVREDVLT